MYGPQCLHYEWDNDITDEQNTDEMADTVAHLLGSGEKVPDFMDHTWDITATRTGYSSFDYHFHKQDSVDSNKGDDDNKDDDDNNDDDDDNNDGDDNGDEKAWKHILIDLSHTL